MNTNLNPSPAVCDVPAGATAVADIHAPKNILDQPDWPPPLEELASLMEKFLDDLPCYEYEAKVMLSLLFSDANPEMKVLLTLLQELVAVFGHAAISVTDMIEEETKRKPTSARMTNLLYDIADMEFGVPDWRTLEEWLSTHAGEEVGGFVLVRSMDPGCARQRSRNRLNRPP